MHNLLTHISTKISHFYLYKMKILPMILVRRNSKRIKNKNKFLLNFKFI